MSHSGFVKLASRIPDIQNQIAKELEFNKEDKVAKITIASSVRKPVIQKNKQPSNESISIQKVVPISDRVNKVIGSSEPNQVFVVNLKKIKANQSGQFELFIPANQQTVTFQLPTKQITKTL